MICTADCNKHQVAGKRSLRKTSSATGPHQMKWKIDPGLNNSQAGAVRSRSAADTPRNDH
jgi:hypothetical protein